MGVISWVITILLILGVVFGFIRGFGHSRPFTLSLIVAILLAYFVGLPIARALMNTSLGSETLTDFYVSKLPETAIFNSSLADLDLVAKQDLMSQALGEMHFPSFVRGFFISNAVILDSSVSVAIASSFSYWTLVAVLFLAFFLLVFIVLCVVFRKLRDLFFGEGGKGILGRIFGAVKGLFKTSVFILTCMAIVSLVNQLMVSFGNTTLQDFLTSDLQLDSSNYSIGRLFYDTTTIFFNWISL